MTAGLVKSALSLDQALGLPKIVAGNAALVKAEPPAGQAVVLRASDLGLYLWVTEGIVSPN